MSRLILPVWDVARPDNASIVTTHGDVSQTSTGDHLPGGARWGYADGNPSSEAPLFLLSSAIIIPYSCQLVVGRPYFERMKKCNLFRSCLHHVYEPTSFGYRIFERFWYLYTRKIIYRTPNFTSILIQAILWMLSQRWWFLCNPLKKDDIRPSHIRNVSLYLIGNKLAYPLERTVTSCCFGVPSGLIVRFVRNEHRHSVGNTQFLGASQNCEKRVLAPSRLSSWNNWASTGRIFIKYREFWKMCRESCKLIWQ
jgi:hypothetical protein